MNKQTSKNISQDTALVMKGGGIKGIAYVGALEELVKHYNFTWYAGTSAGSISAVLLSAGYNTNELKEILLEKNFSDFKDATFLKSIWNLISKKGLYTAKEFTRWINTLVAKKLDSPVEVRLEDLPHRATIFASTKGSNGLIFDSLDPRTKEDGAAFAARCSMSIPIYFTPEKKGGLNVMDGGIQNNYPIELLKSLNPKFNFIGLYLGPETFEGYNSKDSILHDLLSIWTETVDIIALRRYKDQTIIIDTRPISTTDFKLSLKEKEFLLECGRLSALKHLNKHGIVNNLPSDYEIRKSKNNKLRSELTKKKLRKKRKKQFIIIIILLILTTVLFNTKTLITYNDLNKSIKKTEEKTEKTNNTNLNENNISNFKEPKNKKKKKEDSIIKNESVFDHPINNYKTLDPIELKQKITNSDLKKIKLDMPRRIVEKILGLPHNSSSRCDECYFYDFKDILINISYFKGNLYDFIMIRKNKKIKWAIPMYKKLKNLEQQNWIYDSNIIPNDCMFGSFTFSDILSKFKYIDNQEKQNTWNARFKFRAKPAVNYYSRGNFGGTYRTFSFSELYERFYGFTYDIVFTFGTHDHRLYFDVFDFPNDSKPLSSKILHECTKKWHEATKSPIEYTVISNNPPRPSSYEKLNISDGYNEFSSTENYFLDYYIDIIDKTF